MPAVVLGLRTDVLAWNARGHRLLAGHIARDARPNLTRLLFLDAHTRELYTRWTRRPPARSPRCGSWPAASPTTVSSPSWSAS